MMMGWEQTMGDDELRDERTERDAEDLHQSGDVKAEEQSGLSNDRAQAQEERTGGGVSGAMEQVGSIFTQGVDAVKEVSSARRASAEARERLDELDRRIAEADGLLLHRRDVADRYEQIVAAQTARLEAALKKQADAVSEHETIMREIEQLKTVLEQTRTADAVAERRLKATLDAAEAKEASARESGSRLQRRLDDAREALARAEPDREKGVAAAQRAIDSAASRLKTLKAERAEVDRNPSVNSATYSVRLAQLDVEIADATGELEAAKTKLPAITEELNQALLAAKAAAQQAEKPVEQARYAFRSITDEADAARDRYETAKQEASERERGLRDQISAQERAGRAQDQRSADAEDEAQTARTLIEEADEIHAHPEITEELSDRLQADRAAREQLESDVAALADAERNVRERTRRSRLRLIATIVGIACAVIAIALVIWIAIGR